MHSIARAMVPGETRKTTMSRTNRPDNARVAANVETDDTFSTRALFDEYSIHMGCGPYGKRTRDRLRAVYGAHTVKNWTIEHLMGADLAYTPPTGEF